jgi:ribose 5-phosphate isomerase A
LTEANPNNPAHMAANFGKAPVQNVPACPQLEVVLPGCAGMDCLAKAAVAEIKSGMVVGMGTGLTANRAIRALAHRVKEEKLDIDCVSTSKATEDLARELGLPTVPFAEIEVVDYLFDGANEVDHSVRMLKGQHGAITRQRLVAEASRKCVYLASEEKLVPRLGEKALLAVTIIPFGIASIRRRLRDMGLIGVARYNLDGNLYVSEGGGVVLDIRLPERDLDELALELDHVSGIVDHGLFLWEADEVLVDCKGGAVKRLRRPEGE